MADFRAGSEKEQAEPETSCVQRTMGTRPKDTNPGESEYPSNHAVKGYIPFNKIGTLEST